MFPRLGLLLASLLALLTLSTAKSTLAEVTPTITLHIWPVSSPTSTPYLALRYTHPSPPARAPVDPAPAVAILKQYPINPLPSDTDFIRLGFYRPYTKRDGTAATHEESWVGISVPPSSLAASRDKTIRLLANAHGEAYHVGLDSVPAPRPEGKAKGEEVKGKTEAVLDVVKPGPKPVLNKPVVLTKEGKVEGEEVKPGFLQKYWWLLAIFLIMQLAVGGGGKE